MAHRPEPTAGTITSDALARLAAIKAIALDVDGVLTDGTFFWGPDGQEWKRFSFADVMGISLARKQGILFALISGEGSPLVDRFAQKMGITDVYKGCKDKASALRDWMDRLGLSREDVAFMGDDVNDLGAMAAAGFAAAPANANTNVLRVVDLITTRRGGDGSVREMIDLMPASRTQST